LFFVFFVEVSISDLMKGKERADRFENNGIIARCPGGQRGHACPSNLGFASKAKFLRNIVLSESDCLLEEIAGRGREVLHIPQPSTLSTAGLSTTFNAIIGF